jgi:hypothetical protein
MTGKRTREPVDANLESEPTPAKKARALTSKPAPEAEVRRSARGRKPTTKAAPQKRARRTADEIQAAKTAIEVAKRQKVADAEEAERRLVQMDVDGDADHARSSWMKNIRLTSHLQTIIVLFSSISPARSRLNPMVVRRVCMYLVIAAVPCFFSLFLAFFNFLEAPEEHAFSKIRRGWLDFLL